MDRYFLSTDQFNVFSLQVAKRFYESENFSCNPKQRLAKVLDDATGLHNRRMWLGFDNECSDGEKHYASRRKWWTIQNKSWRVKCASI